MDMSRFVQDLSQPLAQWWGQTPTQPQRQGQTSQTRGQNYRSQRRSEQWRNNQNQVTRQGQMQTLGSFPVTQDQGYATVQTLQRPQRRLRQSTPQIYTQGIGPVATQIPDTEQTPTRQDQGTQTQIEVQGQSPQIQQGPSQVQGKSPQIQQGPKQVQGQSPQIKQGPRWMQGQSPQIKQGPRWMQGQSPQIKQGPRWMQGQSPQIKQGPRWMQGQSPQIKQGPRWMQGQSPQIKQGPRWMQGQSSQIQQGPKQVQGQSPQIQQGSKQVQGQSPQIQQAARQMQGQSPQIQQGRAQQTTSGQGSAQAQRWKPRMNDVNMPSGDKVSIVIPSRSTCSCTVVGENLKLITLKPDGKMSGREYKIVADEMNKTLQGHNYKSYTIKQIQKVQNCCLWSKFRAIEKQIAKDARYVNEKMLFHGSAAADAIVKTGFDLNKAKGGLFGHGVYFAKHSSKSNQYSPGYLGHRRMLLCRVALGRMHKTTTSGVTAAPLGHHSVEGNLAVTEYVIYNADQAYPEYLVYYDISN